MKEPKFKPNEEVVYFLKSYNDELIIKRNKISSINVTIENDNKYFFKYKMYNGDDVSQMNVFSTDEELIVELVKNFKSYIKSKIGKELFRWSDITEYSFYGPTLKKLS